MNLPLWLQIDYKPVTTKLNDTLMHRSMRFAANLLITAAALCKSALAFPSGAGACPEGIAAVGDSHLNNHTTGTLAKGGFTVSLGGTALVDGVTSTFSTNTDVALTISGGTFRGFLMRLGETGEVSTDNAFQVSGSDIQISFACLDEGGVTHTSSSDKTTVSATLNMDASAVAMPLDVTVVVKNSGGVSEFYHSQFKLTAASPTGTLVTTICEDAPVSNRFFVYNEFFRSCAYLALNPELIAQKCDERNDPKDLAYTLCPKTCGLCSDGCEDDSKATFNVLSDQSSLVLSCQQLSLRPKLQTAYCRPDSPVMTLCPETCKSCGISLPLVSTLPPSVLTTVVPDTRAPVVPVSATVIDFAPPAPLALVAPSVAPVAPSVAPVAPSVAPVAPSAAPVAPSVAPVAAVVPVAAPVIDFAPPAPVAPVGSPAGLNLVANYVDCQDDPTFMFYIDKEEKSCAWLSDRRPKKKVYCRDKYVKKACPKTCGYCTKSKTCKDNGYKRVSIVTDNMKRGKAKFETCKWLKANPDLWSLNCGVGSEAYQMCRETCNSCSL